MRASFFYWRKEFTELKSKSQKHSSTIQNQTHN